MEVKVRNNKVIASVLAIGTAVPPNEFLQCNYPNFFFNVTNCNDKLELKEKFQRICDKSTIKKRHFYLTEEILKANPEMCNYMGTSLNQRQEIAIREVPKLAKDAASNAIKEWGKPMSCITHLVFCTTSGVDMPGADFQLIKLLGLPLDVKRVMLYQQGCFAGATVIRIAKDLAENNPTARVLAICSEVSALTFRAPSESHLDGLVGSALFGDGAAALIIGSNPSPIEKPLFEVHWSGQSITPDSDNAILGHLHEAGLIFHLLKDVPRLISTNIEKILVKPLQYITAFDNHKQTLSYNDLFWVVHPGGPAILDQVETKLLLNKDRMQATRDVLADYGNMSSASVLFVLDRMRKRSIELNEETIGDGLKWGVMLTFGPGLTIESLVLKSA